MASAADNHAVEAEIYKVLRDRHSITLTELGQLLHKRKCKPPGQLRKFVQQHMGKHGVQLYIDPAGNSDKVVMASRAAPFPQQPIYQQGPLGTDTAAAIRQLLPTVQAQAQPAVNGVASQGYVPGEGGKKGKPAAAKAAAGKPGKGKPAMNVAHLAADVADEGADDANALTVSLSQQLEQLHLDPAAPTRPPRVYHLLVDEHVPNHSYGELGRCANTGKRVLLNTNVPFCMVAVGVQGAGKSHSLGVVLENCMLDVPPTTRAQPPTSAIVFHYDKSDTNFCEAVTLAKPRVPSGPAVQSLVVFVSPSYYYQRSVYYRDIPNCTVLPLLFRWRDLTASFIKSLMRVKVGDDVPLYMSVVLEKLRKHQKANVKPTFKEFIEELTGDSGTFMPQQRVGLEMRLQLLTSLLAESAENEKLFKQGSDINSVLQRGAGKAGLVIVDLTDPMLDGAEANGIFQVVLDMFKRVQTKCNKIAVFDEAHKYLQPSGADELSDTITEIARQMRHHGISLAVSTQSPRCLPPELLELASFSLIHRFHSRDWFNALRARLPLRDEDYQAIMDSETGSPLVFSLYWSDSRDNNIRPVNIRPRLTKDGGATRQANAH